MSLGHGSLPAAPFRVGPAISAAVASPTRAHRGVVRAASPRPGPDHRLPTACTAAPPPAAAATPKTVLQYHWRGRLLPRARTSRPRWGASAVAGFPGCRRGDAGCAACGRENAGCACKRRRRLSPAAAMTTPAARPAGGRAPAARAGRADLRPHDRRRCRLRGRAVTDAAQHQRSAAWRRREGGRSAPLTCRAHHRAAGQSV